MLKLDANNPFAYLNERSIEDLRRRLNTIEPAINFLLELYNSPDKVVSLDMACLSKEKKLLTHYLHFNSLSTGETWFPDELQLFFHELCTKLCAEKSCILFMLS